MASPGLVKASSPGRLEEQDVLVEQLRSEICRLKEQLHCLSCLGQGHVATGCMEDDDLPGPVAHVFFFSSKESLCSRQRIEDCLTEVAGTACESQMQVEVLGRHYQPNAVELTTGGCHGDMGECSCEKTTLKVVGAVEYYQQFCLDHAGWPVSEVNGEWQLEEGCRVVYPQVYLEPFWMDKLSENEDRRRRRMSIKCFNCGEDHHIRDCEQPRNPARINLHRQQYMDSLGTPGSDRRYHVSADEDRFKKFSPGKISDKLRKALGIGEGDYPPHIYRMRELGYPPGYRLLVLEESLTLYQDSSETVTPPEIKEIIIYPGFNDCSDSSSNSTGGGGAGSSHLQQSPGMADPAPSLFPTSAKNKRTEEFGDLGSLSDYEFEEGEEGAGDMVGFGLKKLLRSQSASEEPEGCTKNDNTENELAKPKKAFSMDFPPGLVHCEAECEDSPKKWSTLKKILSAKNPQQT